MRNSQNERKMSKMPETPENKQLNNAIAIDPTSRVVAITSDGTPIFSIKEEDVIMLCSMLLKGYAELQNHPKSPIQTTGLGKIAMPPISPN